MPCHAGAGLAADAHFDIRYASTDVCNIAINKIYVYVTQNNVQGLDYLLKRINVGHEKMDLVSHRILATAACSLVSYG
jgi:hypothetical protein